ncbi:unnamed protein product [Amoebophrya sp. A25]|nr:unnamed protein product [Amoebophrya sp. A25]|eukprot:GSA25T00017560001.1
MDVHRKESSLGAREKDVEHREARAGKIEYALDAREEGLRLREAQTRQLFDDRESALKRQESELDRTRKLLEAAASKRRHRVLTSSKEASSSNFLAVNIVPSSSSCSSGNEMTVRSRSSAGTTARAANNKEAVVASFGDAVREREAELMEARSEEIRARNSELEAANTKLGNETEVLQAELDKQRAAYEEYEMLSFQRLDTLQQRCSRLERTIRLNKRRQEESRTILEQVMSAYRESGSLATSRRPSVTDHERGFSKSSSSSNGSTQAVAAWKNDTRTSSAPVPVLDRKASSHDVAAALDRSFGRPVFSNSSSRTSSKRAPNVTIDPDLIEAISNLLNSSWNTGTGAGSSTSSKSTSKASTVGATLQTTAAGRPRAVTESALEVQKRNEELELAVTRNNGQAVGPSTSTTNGGRVNDHKDHDLLGTTQANFLSDSVGEDGKSPAGEPDSNLPGASAQIGTSLSEKVSKTDSGGSTRSRTEELQQRALELERALQETLKAMATSSPEPGAYVSVPEQREPAISATPLFGAAQQENESRGVATSLCMPSERPQASARNREIVRGVHLVPPGETCDSGVEPSTAGLARAAFIQAQPAPSPPAVSSPAPAVVLPLSKGGTGGARRVVTNMMKLPRAGGSGNSSSSSTQLRQPYAQGSSAVGSTSAVGIAAGPPRGSGPSNMVVPSTTAFFQTRIAASASGGSASVPDPRGAAVGPRGDVVGLPFSADSSPLTTAVAATSSLEMLPQPSQNQHLEETIGNVLSTAAIGGGPAMCSTANQLHSPRHACPLPEQGRAQLSAPARVRILPAATGSEESVQQGMSSSSISRIAEAARHLGSHPQDYPTRSHSSVSLLMGSTLTPPAAAQHSEFVRGGFLNNSMLSQSQRNHFSFYDHSPFEQDLHDALGASRTQLSLSSTGQARSQSVFVRSYPKKETVVGTHICTTIARGRLVGSQFRAPGNYELRSIQPVSPRLTHPPDLRASSCEEQEPDIDKTSTHQVIGEKSPASASAQFLRSTASTPSLQHPPTGQGLKRPSPGVRGGNNPFQGTGQRSETDFHHRSLVSSKESSRNADDEAHAMYHVDLILSATSASSAA